MSGGWLSESEFVKESSSGGGGGYVGRVRVDMGFKVFVSGMYKDSFIVCNDLEDKGLREKARQKAQKILDEHGKSDKNPQQAVRITRYKDSVLNKAVNWQGNLYDDFPLWTPAATEIVLPSLDEQLTGPEELGTDFWARVSFKEDPEGRTQEYQGETRVVLIPYIAERYADEDTARAAAEGVEVGSEVSGLAASIFPNWAESKFADSMSAAEVVDYVIGKLSDGLPSNLDTMPPPVKKKALEDAESLFQTISEEFGGEVTVEQVKQIQEQKIPF